MKKKETEKKETVKLSSESEQLLSIILKNFGEINTRLDKLELIEKNIKETNSNISNHIKSLLEIQNELVHNKLGTVVPQVCEKSASTTQVIKKSTYPSDKKKTSIVVNCEGNKIYFSGNTFQYRETLKRKFGAFWDGNTKTWSTNLSPNDLERIKSTLDTEKISYDVILGETKTVNIKVEEDCEEERVKKVSDVETCDDDEYCISHEMKCVLNIDDD